MVNLSVVFGTYNRFAHLQGCVESIRKYVTRPYEIIIADGGSTDGGREWMVAQDDIIMIGERTLHGAVDAYNKAFSISFGQYVAHLNDDCYLQDNCLDAACDIMDKEENIGQVAIPFNDDHPRKTLNYIHMGNISILYANFGVVRKTVGDMVGWWGNYLHTYGGDCELSFQIWNAGYRVVPLRGYALYHHRVNDALRRENVESRKFFVKWDGKVSQKWDSKEG